MKAFGFNDLKFLKGLRISGGDTVEGTRLPDGHHEVMPAGSYGRNAHGAWEACTPNGRRGVLDVHTVEEHDDGTITVDPSIRVDPILTPDDTVFRAGWHGFLEKGVWREV